MNAVASWQRHQLSVSKAGEVLAPGDEALKRDDDDDDDDGDRARRHAHERRCSRCGGSGRRRRRARGGQAALRRLRQAEAKAVWAPLLTRVHGIGMCAAVRAGRRVRRQPALRRARAAGRRQQQHVVARRRAKIDVGLDRWIADATKREVDALRLGSLPTGAPSGAPSAPSSSRCRARRTSDRAADGAGASRVDRVAARRVPAAGRDADARGAVGGGIRARLHPPHLRRRLRHRACRRALRRSLPGTPRDPRRDHVRRVRHGAHPRGALHAARRRRGGGRPVRPVLRGPPRRAPRRCARAERFPAQRGRRRERRRRGHRRRDETCRGGGGGGGQCGGARGGR